MRTIYEEITLSVDTKKNAVPNGKLMAGRLSVDENGFEANFEEEEGAVAVFKERNAKRIMRGKNCSVWWNPVDEVYKVHLTINPEEKMCLSKAEWNAEDCINFIKRRMSSIQN